MLGYAGSIAEDQIDVGFHHVMSCSCNNGYGHATLGEAMAAHPPVGQWMQSGDEDFQSILETVDDHVTVALDYSDPAAGPDA